MRQQTIVYCNYRGGALLSVGYTPAFRVRIPTVRPAVSSRPWYCVGSLALLLLIAFNSRTVHAQASPDCATSPCIKVGLEFDNDFHDDEAHFIYCPKEQTVQITILARMNHAACGGCEHPPRQLTWTVEGATDLTVVSETAELVGSETDAFATYEVGNAGDSFTIKCEAAALPLSGECDEDKNGDPGEHTAPAFHAAADATCTIKLWRLDMDVTGGNAEQDVISPFIYKTTFADSVTTQATLVGASPAATNPWEWASSELMDYEELNTMSGSSSWAGTMVAETGIEVTARVTNACDPSSTRSRDDVVIVRPTKRRSGWDNMAVTHAGQDDDWMKLEADAFPVLSEFDAWAQNTNIAPYTEYNQEFVTPVYSGDAVEPEDLADSDGVCGAILSGPNFTLWYLSDPGLFKCARFSRINHWITPQAQKPGTAPTLGPQGICYSNWCDIYTVMSTDTCACSNPSSHGGVGSDIRYRANVWHEGFGCPSSPNQDELGHQIRIENAVSNGDKDTYDAIRKSDILYKKSLTELRNAAESVRSFVSNKLKTESLKVHTFVTNAPHEHNFRGVMWLTDGSTWSTDGAVSTY